MYFAIKTQRQYFNCKEWITPKIFYFIPSHRSTLAWDFSHENICILKHAVMKYDCVVALRLGSVNSWRSKKSSWQIYNSEMLKEIYLIYLNRSWITCYLIRNGSKASHCKRLLSKLLSNPTAGCSHYVSFTLCTRWSLFSSLHATCILSHFPDVSIYLFIYFNPMLFHYCSTWTILEWLLPLSLLTTI